MATKAKAQSTTTNTSAKQGQKAKKPAPAPVLPTLGKATSLQAMVVNASAPTAKAAGVKASAHYPQGNAKLVLPGTMPAGHSATLQGHYTAIQAAIKAVGNNCNAVAKHLGQNGYSNARRPIRQLARAGVLGWQD